MSRYPATCSVPPAARQRACYGDAHGRSLGELAELPALDRSGQPKKGDDGNVLSAYWGSVKAIGGAYRTVCWPCLGSFKDFVEGPKKERPRPSLYSLRAMLAQEKREEAERLDNEAFEAALVEEFSPRPKAVPAADIKSAKKHAKTAARPEAAAGELIAAAEANEPVVVPTPVAEPVYVSETPADPAEEKTGNSNPFSGLMGLFGR